MNADPSVDKGLNPIIKVVVPHHPYICRWLVQTLTEALLDAKRHSVKDCLRLSYRLTPIIRINLPAKESVVIEPPNDEGVIFLQPFCILLDKLVVKWLSLVFVLIFEPIKQVYLSLSLRQGLYISPDLWGNSLNNIGVKIVALIILTYMLTIYVMVISS